MESPRPNLRWVNGRARQSLGIVVLLALLLGCGPTKNPSASPTTAPAPAPAPAPPTSRGQSSVAYEDKQAKFRLSYPADWKPTPSKDYVLALVPADEATAAKA